LDKRRQQHGSRATHHPLLPSRQAPSSRSCPSPSRTSTPKYRRPTCLPFSYRGAPRRSSTTPRSHTGGPSRRSLPSSTLGGLFILSPFTHHFITTTTSHRGEDLRQSIRTQHNTRSTPPTTNHGQRQLAPTRGLRHRPFDATRAPRRRHHVPHPTFLGVCPSS
jgi:hypothetical protein